MKLLGDEFTSLHYGLLERCWDALGREEDLSPREVVELAFALGQVWSTLKTEGRTVSEIELPFIILFRATGAVLVEVEP